MAIEILAKESFLDFLLAGAEIVQSVVKAFLVELAQTEHFSDGVIASPTNGRQTRTLMANAGQDQEQGEFAKFGLAEGGGRPMSSATCLSACRRPKTGPEVGSGKATASSSPRRRRRKASMRRRGQEVMLAMVRFLTLPFSRKDSRRRTAGGEVRLGISATYMCSEYRTTLVKSISIPHIT